MQNTVTLLLADYDHLKRVQEKAGQLLEFDKNKDRYVKIGYKNSYDFTIKNSVDGDELLAKELNRLNNELEILDDKNYVLQYEVERLNEELLKLKLMEHTRKRWSLWR